MKRTKRELDLMDYLNQRLQVIITTAGNIKDWALFSTSPPIKEEFRKIASEALQIEEQVETAAAAIRKGKRP